MPPDRGPTPLAASDVPDETIVIGILAGDTEFFAALIARHNQRLYRVGRAYLRDHDAVEDAMQNAYVKAFRNLKQFRRGSSFATWLTRIMINECLMALRKERSLREDRIDDTTLENIPSAQRSANDASHLDEMKAILEKTVAELPLSYRTVYVLRDIQHLSTAEAARCLGVSLVSAKVKLHRARTMIRERLLADAAASELFAYNAKYCTAMTERVMRAIANSG